MALTPEQIQELKRQLHEQVKHLPEDQRVAADKQIDEMSGEAIEEMLNQQMAAQQGEGGQQMASPGGSGEQKGIFRMLVDGDVPTKKVDENDFAIAIVSKKAISKGHLLVIPKTAKETEKDLPKSVVKLAETLAKRVKSKLKAKAVSVVVENAFGESVVDVIPQYDKEVNLQSPRYDASDEEIEEVAKKLKVVKKVKKEKIKINTKKKEDDVIKLSRRVP
jgi:histidine triad (HIT) family protein